MMIATRKAKEVKYCGKGVPREDEDGPSGSADQHYQGLKENKMVLNKTRRAEAYNAVNDFT